MAGAFGNIAFPQGFFPDGFWPDGFWPKPPQEPSEPAALRFIEQAIYRLAASDETLTALIGTRLYPMHLPAGERRAAVVYQQIAETEGLTTAGAIGLIDARFQFTCWASDHVTALAVARVLRCLLEDYAGDLNGIVIAHTRILGRGDIPAMDEQAEQLKRFGKYLDCRISYSRSAA